MKRKKFYILIVVLVLVLVFTFPNGTALAADIEICSDFDYLAALQTGGDYILTIDVNVPSAINNPPNITTNLKMNGHTVTYNVQQQINGTINVSGEGSFVRGLSYTDDIFSIANTGALRVADCTINGAGTNVVNSAVSVAEDGLFEMTSGSIINNIITNGNNGGAVNVKGTFNMNGGIISNCKAYYGGGVTVDSTGEFNMSGGVISNNAATGDGGGVYILGESNISGGEISNNTAVSDGGGVALNGEGNLEISGSTQIYNNEAGQGGGGVAVNGDSMFAHSTVIIGSGVEITRNSTNDGEGGGIYIPTFGDVTVNGATISNNRANTYGGGVFIGAFDAHFTMNSGVLYGNTGNTSGADLASSYNPILLIPSGTFSLPAATSMGLPQTDVDAWYMDIENDRFSPGTSTSSDEYVPVANQTGTPSQIFDLIAASLIPAVPTPTPTPSTPTDNPPTGISPTPSAPIVNPQTGDKSVNIYIYLLGIVLTVVFTVGGLIIKRKRQDKAVSKR